MSKRAVLGKVATEAYQEYLDYLEANAKDLEKLGLQEFRNFTPDMEDHYKAYKFMNGLGFVYGLSLIHI